MKFYFFPGRQHVTLNVHCLLHQATSVKFLGGLHGNSCFDFEDFNGTIKNSVHGTQYIHSQVTTCTYTVENSHNECNITLGKNSSC